ncbi:carbon-nitrogen hydrolase family protein [Flavilitoribacter nigricans]|uniref:Carbon-nitrogen hydrolase family protein n=1 Tax=Flavilitoribacter nigricans (strain ATCC 23147 / DSM 23189 / NBRC 102662 / NCIMB 1420 / SS-2) TaxID=1122177 RepID=A0A2D0N0X6_FLAN2|nr:carbon-nitrogen hydrolase family protein [Flavilitoribacter nigricans]PHN01799.1 carbon-nitrogen hydrolase family protein [Flavilitoribacter nigricans DSM 23189 = NBRC 102662]
MKICLAQISAVPGDIAANINSHRESIRRAAAHGGELIVFPELSLSGYEPTLMKDMAVAPDDPRLQVFQQLSKQHAIRIALGVPLQTADGIAISMLIYYPDRERQVYYKTYLHADEEPYFTSVPNEQVTLADHPELALAICYEISVPGHIDRAAADAARFYLASVVKFTNGMEAAAARLTDIARSYGMTVMTVNAVGHADGGLCGGQSGVWNTDGRLLGSLDSTETGLLIYDTETQVISNIPENE